MAAQRKMTFGIVVGNRGFFPDHLAKTGREEIIAVLEAAGATGRSCSAPKNRSMARWKPTPKSQRCAELFKKHAEEIDGIIVTLPNFGEERGIVDAIRLSGPQGSGAGAGHARPLRRHDHRHAPRQLLRQDERLQQPDAVRHSLLADHAAHREPWLRPSSRPTSNGSPQVCRIVKGLKNLRIGAIGARPDGLQHRALLRAHLRDQRHHHRDRSTCLRSSAASTA